MCRSSDSVVVLLRRVGGCVGHSYSHKSRRMYVYVEEQVTRVRLRLRLGVRSVEVEPRKRWMMSLARMRMYLHEIVYETGDQGWTCSECTDGRQSQSPKS
jgi:hypothetical protein